MVSPAPDIHIKNERMSESDTDEAFQALLSSQREILAQLDFGNSNSELQYEYTEGPDNLTVVSPNASAEFHASYSSQPFEEEVYFPPGRQQSMGIGDDRFILDEITIGPGKARGPAVFQVDQDSRRRKRETEQELMGVVAQRKKRRNGSITGMDRNMVHTGASFYSPDADTVFCNDLLPGPSDLTDLDTSSTSLLLDDLDFPSIHSQNDVTEDNRDDDQEEAASSSGSPKVEVITTTPSFDDAMDTDEKEEKAVDAKESPKLNPCVSMDEDNTRPRPPRRSQASMWKPRPVTTPSENNSKKSMADQRSLWKPRKRQSIVTSGNDSCASLKMEDLETSKRFVARTVSSQSEAEQRILHVSILDGDLDDKKCPSRTSSGDSVQSVKSLSNALQQSLDTTKTIQEWDRKMGLKKSHSKTMRQTNKTREQLLSFLKKEQQERAAAVTGLEGDLNNRDEAKPAVVAL